MSSQQARSSKKADPFYVSKEWKKVRHYVLKRDDWYCEKCGVQALGRRFKRPSPHVDHIIPRKQDPSRALDPTNLRTLCHSCHSKVSIADIHGRDKPEIGLDGFPVIECGNE